MKKILALLIVVLLSVSAIYAGITDEYKGTMKKDALAVGLNAGTNSGVVVNYGMGDFDLEGIVGFSFINGSGLDVEVAANYEVADFSKDLKIKGSMPFTVGGEAGVWMKFGDAFKLGVNALVPLKVTYSFPKFPMNVYLRIAPGLELQIVDAINIGFGIQGSIGATYNF